jgi:sarcosine oxidase
LTYDLIVLGLGGMGSSTVAHAASRGRRVLGIEQFPRGHAFGSSTGRTRIIRKAYYEDPAYVPLVLRAYERWRDLEAETGAHIVDLVGLLTLGDPNGEVIQGTLRSARAYGLPLEILDEREVRRRFAGTRPREGEMALLERDAGIVVPERAIEAYLSMAEQHGAELRFGVAAQRYDAGNGGVTVTMNDGTVVTSARLALCAGAWTASFAREMRLALQVQRNVQLWFGPSTDAFTAARFPAFFVERSEWPAPLYGFPDQGLGVKAALHGYGELTSAAALDREIHDADVDCVRGCLEAWMPGAAGTFREGKACMYALSPDRHFIIDRSPQSPRVVVAAGFSGHGFKFASVVGEIVADLAFEGGTRHPIQPFAIGRFAR